jgi:hypothetical protein
MELLVACGEEQSSLALLHKFCFMIATLCPTYQLREGRHVQLTLRILSYTSALWPLLGVYQEVTPMPDLSSFDIRKQQFETCLERFLDQSTACCWSMSAPKL